MSEETIQEMYEVRSGDHGLKRFNEIVVKVKAGKLTYGQAASVLGITYYEFVLLMEEAGVIR